MISLSDWRLILVGAGFLLLALYFALKSRPKPFSFRPPRFNRLLVRLFEWQLPRVLRRLLNVVEVEVDPRDLERLRPIVQQRCIICPNHPTTLDPIVLFHLAKALGRNFYFLASVEAFESPLHSWLLPRLGAYSITRGTVDRDSFRTTRKLLVAGERPVVIFPEGEACGHGDLLMPLREGVAQFGFWALEDLGKQNAAPPLYLVPVALKYLYLRDMSDEIKEALLRLEDALGLSSSSEKATAPYQRLRQIGEALLISIQREYNIRPAKEADFGQRIEVVKSEIARRAAGLLGVALQEDLPLLDRIRQLFVAADRIMYEETDGSSYERELHKQRETEIRALYSDLWRVLRFVAIRDGYVRETMTVERFFDIINLVEIEVFGQAPPRGPRKAIIKVGNPISLTDYLPAYQKDKRATLREVTAGLETELRRQMQEMTHLGMPLPVARSATAEPLQSDS